MNQPCDPNNPADFSGAGSKVPQFDRTPELGTSQNLNFAPRFGLAYQITPKLVARGGFGVFYGGFEVQNGNNQGNSFPYQFNFGLFSPNSSTAITVPGLTNAPAGCTQAYTFELGFTCTPLDPSLPDCAREPCAAPSVSVPGRHRHGHRDPCDCHGEIAALQGFGERYRSWCRAGRPAQRRPQRRHGAG